MASWTFLLGYRKQVCPAGWRMRWVSWKLQKLLPVGNPLFSASVHPSSSLKVSIKISAAHLVMQLDADGQHEHPSSPGVPHLEECRGRRGPVETRKPAVDKTSLVTSAEGHGERELLPLVLEGLQSENLCGGGAYPFACQPEPVQLYCCEEACPGFANAAPSVPPSSSSSSSTDSCAYRTDFPSNLPPLGRG